MRSETEFRHPHRVLHVMTHLIHGGTEFYVLRVCAALDDLRFSPAVAYLGSRSEIIDHFRSADIHPVSVDHRGPMTAIRTVWRLARMIRTLDIHVVQTHSRMDRLYGQLAALATGVPVVDTLHSHYAAERYSSTRSEGSRLQRLRLVIEDWVRRRTVKAVICVSEAVADTWQKNGRAKDPGLTLAKAVPPPLRLSDYDHVTSDIRLQRKASLGIARRWPILVNVGRMVPGKNQAALVQVMTEVIRSWPQASLLLVGDGAQRDEVETAVRGAGIEDHVVFLGARHDVPTILSVADVFISPSLSEGLGLVFVEAVASGLPILSFDLPAVHSLVEDGINGYRVSTGDIDQMTAATIRLLQSLEEVKEGAEKVRAKLVPLFDGRTLNVCLDEIYSSVRGYS